jgi:hypothetical protein
MEGFANKPVDFDLLTKEMARVLGVEVEAVTSSSTVAESSKLIDEKMGVALWGTEEFYYQQLGLFFADN